MPEQSTFRIVGDWKRQVEVPIADALRVSQDLWHRSAGESCKHAIIMMAASAKAITRKAAARRIVKSNTRGQYVEVYNQRTVNRERDIFKWMTKDHANLYPRTWEQVKKMPGTRGLAGRSWFWGMSEIGGSNGSKPIPGMSAILQRYDGMRAEVIKQNKLPWITKIMPSGWENAVAVAATNRIMAMAARKLEAIWRRALDSGNLKKVAA